MVIIVFQIYKVQILNLSTHPSIFLQAYTLKRYPAQLSLTTWMSFVGAAQSAFYTVIVQHKRAAWTIGFNIDFWSTIYGVRRFQLSLVVMLLKLIKNTSGYISNSKNNTRFGELDTNMITFLKNLININLW